MTTTEEAVPDAKRKPIWDRHRGLAIAAAVLVIALITVLSDLPTSTTRASDISAERAVMSEVNSDLQPCAYSIKQALGIWSLETNHRLTPSDRAPTPGLLSDDQSACSFTNEGIYDLTNNIDTPGTAAGKQLGNLVATATLWVTSDALQSIEDVQRLLADPKDTAAARNLSKEEGLLASDRRTALAEENAADRDLETRLPSVDLPSLSPTTSSDLPSLG
ncbi:MAG TPA: hypothetical protein VK773_08855 [Acidimicrobiales bacterium]|jgi:hypothetical protein|nr:hypothetical protein [Acidimicrobiales bacterium]